MIRLRLSALSLAAAAVLFGQAATAPPEKAPSASEREEPLYVEAGGFTNFVNNGYGQWSGASGKVMFRGAKHFAPIVGFATQKRPYGSQQTYGLDSYILVNKWFYAIAGVGGSPKGSAELFPRLRYGAMGLFTVPKARGLLATVSAAQIHGEGKAYGRILTAGAMLYRGRAIWSGHVAFNRAYPGAVPSKSGGIAVQYGGQKRYWIGGGMTGGRIAYQMIALRPVAVEYLSFGPNVFYQRWVTRKWGFIAKYDYQNQLEAYQRHGISASLFFEFP